MKLYLELMELEEGFFLVNHFEWFLQNLGKDFIRTNMHKTVTDQKARII